MRVVIHAHQLATPRGLSAFLHKHLVQALRRLHDSPADQLTVYLEDTTPRKGGQDQACKVTFRMAGARALRVESVQDDLHAALLDCAQRLKRLVQRQVEKARSPSRAPMHKPLGRSWRGRSTGGELAPDGTPSTL